MEPLTSLEILDSANAKNLYFVYQKNSLLFFD